MNATKPIDRVYVMHHSSESKEALMAHKEPDGSIIIDCPNGKRVKLRLP